jgi:hypothetical protein
MVVLHGAPQKLKLADGLLLEQSRGRQKSNSERWKGEKDSGARQPSTLLGSSENPGQAMTEEPLLMLRPLAPHHLRWTPCTPEQASSLLPQCPRRVDETHFS